MGRFDYIKYDEKSAEKQAAFKKKFIELEVLGEDILGPSRWTSLFLTHLEFSYMAVGKQIRDMQTEKELEEGRSNS